MKLRIGPATGAYAEYSGQDDTLVQVENDGTLTVWGKAPDTQTMVVVAGVSERIAPASIVAETIPRVGLTNTAPLSTGRLSVQGIKLRKGQVATSITFVSATQAAVNPSHWLFCLHAPDSDGTGAAILGTTADQLTTAWAASTAKTVALAAPYTATATGVYYVGLFMVADTVVSLAGLATLVATNTIAPVKGGTADGSLTTAAPATLGTVTPVVTDIYAYVS